jgi:hypothetical protein
MDFLSTTNSSVPKNNSPSPRESDQNNKDKLYAPKNQKQDNKPLRNESTEGKEMKEWGKQELLRFELSNNTKKTIFTTCYQTQPK